MTDFFTPLDQVDAAVSSMRDNYNKGVNKTYKQRMANLEALEKFVKDEEENIFAALFADLGKSKPRGPLDGDVGRQGRDC